MILVPNTWVESTREPDLSRVIPVSSKYNLCRVWSLFGLGAYMHYSAMMQFKAITKYEELNRVLTTNYGYGLGWYVNELYTKLLMSFISDLKLKYRI